MMMSESDKTSYGGCDLEVSRARASRKENELLYFYMCVSTYRLCAKKKGGQGGELCCIKHSGSPISSIIVFLFPKRKEED